MDDYYLVVTIFIVFGFIIWFITHKTKSDKEYEGKLKERLEDEHIIDRETGPKITLEQAESGQWAVQNSEFRKASEAEIEKLPTEEQKIIERAINYFIGNPLYSKQEITSEQDFILEHTKTLGKYDDWTYSDSFKLEYCDGFVLLPSVRYNAITRYQDMYNESQCMFWIKLKIDLGHYLLREKTSTEKIFDLIKDDDEIKLSGYESFTFESTTKFSYLTDLINNFVGQKGLEIEFMKDNLFIKNSRLVNIEDIKRIEEIVKVICRKR
ncbi:MAG: hypothetical protein Q8M15_12700 [Bacteroidota bacterium]|nr:hypothetical protein [Bacteroidota bacterium]